MISNGGVPDCRVDVVPAWTGLGSGLERHGVHMIPGRHSVATNADSTEPAGGRSPCTFAPVRHEVTITGWDYLDHGEGRDVVFGLRDDDGRRQGVRFGLGDLELASGQLARFIATVLQRKPAQPEGMGAHFARQMWLNRAVGRRVVLLVVETSRGVQVAVDWESVPEGMAEAIHGGNNEGLSTEAELKKGAVAC